MLKTYVLTEVDPRMTVHPGSDKLYVPLSRGHQMCRRAIRCSVGTLDLALAASVDITAIAALPQTRDRVNTE